jgi:hypothetical protein
VGDADSGGDLESVASPLGSIAVTAGGGPDVEVEIATAFALPQGCADDDIPAWDGDSWECVTDADTDTNSGGTIQNITSTDNSIVVGNGTGPNTTLVVAPTFALPQGCDDGEVAAWDTSLDPDGWNCVVVSAGGGSGYNIFGGTRTGKQLDDSTNYLSLFYSEDDSSSEPSTQEYLMGGTFTALKVEIAAQPGVGNGWTFTLRRAGADTAVACTITHPDTTCGWSGSEDLAGGLYSLRGSKSGAANTAMSFALAFTPSP